jgi:hypothetical protein
MHAVVVNVTIANGQFDGAQKVLQDNVVPQVSKAPGFVKGYWTASSDRRTGISLVVFKTQSDAETAAKMVRSQPAPAPGVTLGTVEVREVVAEA